MNDLQKEDFLKVLCVSEGEREKEEVGGGNSFVSCRIAVYGDGVLAVAVPVGRAS